MRRLSRKLLLFTALLLLAGGAGAVNLHDVSLFPDDDLWLSESFGLNGKCTNNTADNILYVDNLTFIDSSGEQTVYPLDSDDLRFDNFQGQLSSEKLSPYITGPGHYFLDIRCEGTGDPEETSINFTVQELGADLSGDNDFSELYTGTTHRIRLDVYREPGGERVTGETSFEVSADGNALEILEPSPFLKNGRWVVDYSLPESERIYDFEVLVSHNGGETTVSREIDVKKSLDLSVSLSSPRVEPGEEVDLTVTASHEGNPLTIARNDISVSLDSLNLADNITEKSVNAGKSVFGLVIPEKSPGVYTLDVDIEKDGVSASEEIEVRYPITIGGTFQDIDNSPIDFTLTFLEGDRRVLRIDGRGDYSARIVPGDYDVDLDFQSSSLSLEDVNVSRWDNPMRYNRYESTRVNGLTVGGLYAFRSDLDFSTASIDMDFTTRNIERPESLKVFRCPEWNFERGSCYSSWVETPADFDRVNSIATIETESLGAFAVGKREGLRVTHTLSKTTYLPDEQLEFSGLVRDAGGNAVPNANVTVNVNGGGVARTSTDGSGTFEFSVPVPQNQGSYTATVTASKVPYSSGSSSLQFEVERPPGIEIVVPDSLDVRRNETTETTIYVKNTGYRRIQDIAPTTDKVPFFERAEFNAGPIDMEETRELTLHLDVPENAEIKTHTAEIGFSYGGEEKSKVFGINVKGDESTTVQNNETGPQTTGMISRSLSSLPDLPSSMKIPGVNLGGSLITIVAGIVAIQVLVVLFFYFRSGGGGEEKRDRVMRTVSHIKSEVRDGE